MKRYFSKSRLYGWAIATFLIPTGVILAQPTVAQAQNLPAGLSRADVQRLSGDLTRINSQDFFRRGQEQFEREVHNLDRQPLAQPDDVLKIREQPPLPEELSPTNSPKVPSKNKTS